MAALLHVTRLDAYYGHTQALYQVDFSVEEGGITAILGANGAGKTTALRAVSGMIRRQGALRFGDRDIRMLSTESIARLGIGHVPDGRGTFIDLSVEENLRVGAHSRSDSLQIVRDIQRTYNYFPRLGERRAQRAGSLSGGEQQMLAIGRALMLRPRLLMMDEPSFGLAPIVIRDIFRIIRRITREEKVSVLLVEQNVTQALDLADHAYVLETGRVVLAGSSDEVRRDEVVRKSYLGQ